MMNLIQQFLWWFGTGIIGMCILGLGFLALAVTWTLLRNLSNSNHVSYDFNKHDLACYASDSFLLAVGIVTLLWSGRALVWLFQMIFT